MSEEILKALTQLFAIITKLDSGVSRGQRQYVIDFFQRELDQESVKAHLALYDEFSGYGREEEGAAKTTVTTVQDSVRTLNICKKINRTLTQKQKVVVLIKLLELVGVDRNYSAQRMDIINTVATVFNLPVAEYELIERFVAAEDISRLNSREVLLVCNEKPAGSAVRFEAAAIDHLMVFIRVRSVSMYFVKYLGEESQMLNGFVMQQNKVYLFSHGSTIKLQSGNAIYFSDIIAVFNDEIRETKLSFHADIQSYHFANGTTGLHHLTISEGPGKLIGIMGASGAGKTTLLNVLAGLSRAEGSIKINGFDIHADQKEIFGLIGYVSQDDLLIEELTVYQNLYYNAKLCFADTSDEEIHQRVVETLSQLGLDQRKNLKVGSVLDKTISGGQRKRLNIALELIREPSILFLDEPTSGLSSRDSENVIDLLKELSLKGKLIFTVIHQPFSDIYKMFDKMIIMDTGGFIAYYGPPVEAVSYFKRATRQADSNRGQCETCGNVNPEQIFNIIEAKVVDEYGQATTKRKISPGQWYGWYKERFNLQNVPEVKELPSRSLHLPGKLKQVFIFTARDVRAKLSNNQYLLINLLETPILALILALFIKYRNAPEGGGYLFRFNENFPAYLLMSIVVAIFMGLSVSAEEIIRDRKILKRESFLNLSWNSYLVSKVIILFCMSGIQMILFVLIGNTLLEVEWSMLIPYWAILFSAAACAGTIGLNISSAFNSAVTVYILIPLLLIPQMIFSGLLFSFDKLNDLISTKGKVPLVADFMVSRWAFEGISVYTFRHNSFEEPYFSIELEEANADFKAAYIADALRNKVIFANEHLTSTGDSIKRRVESNLALVRSELAEEPYREGLGGVSPETDLYPGPYTEETGRMMLDYLDGYRRYYREVFNERVAYRERMITWFEENDAFDYNLNRSKDLYYNESLADLVKNVNIEERIIEFKGRLVRQIDPIFIQPLPSGPFDYRTQFFAPEKAFLGLRMDTFYFNILVIWGMALFFYVALYFKWLKKLIRLFGRVRFRNAR